MDDAALNTLMQDVAKKEYGEAEDVRRDSLIQLRSWVEKNPNIKKCRTDDAFLVGFLRSKKYSVVQAEEMVLKFLQYIQTQPKLTRNLDILDRDIDFIFSNGCFYPSPFRDDHGRRVMIMSSPASLHPSSTRFSDVARTMITVRFSFMDDPASQVLGYIYIIDMGGIDTSHLSAWSPLELATIFKLGQRAVPIRHKEIHVINLHSMAKVLFNFAFCLLTKKIKERVFIHNSLEDLHNKVSPRVLPKEYGGTMPGTEMIEWGKKKMIDARDVVLKMSHMNMLLPNESEVLEVGSFRKLNID